MKRRSAVAVAEEVGTAERVIVHAPITQQTFLLNLFQKLEKGAREEKLLVEPI